jgi:S-adenosylmethionine:tRNA-ribosyltransferase-isomerase (queuine synthetase)
VLFLPDVKGTTQKTLDKLLEFVKSGGRVFCIGTYPFRSLGLQDYEQRDAKVKAHR